MGRARLLRSGFKGFFALKLQRPDVSEPRTRLTFGAMFFVPIPVRRNAQNTH